MKKWWRFEMFPMLNGYSRLEGLEETRCIKFTKNFITSPPIRALVRKYIVNSFLSRISFLFKKWGLTLQIHVFYRYYQKGFPAQYAIVTY